MPICFGCGRLGKFSEMIKCPECRKHYHKIANCVEGRTTNFKDVVLCPKCKKETYSYNRRYCKNCGAYLWTFHFDCGKNFK